MSNPEQREITISEVDSQGDRGRPGPSIDHATRAHLQAERTGPPDDRAPTPANFNKGFMGFLRKVGCCCVSSDQHQDIRQRVQEEQGLPGGVPAPEQRSSDTTTSQPPPILLSLPTSPKFLW